ncbi:hypothetical protein Tco_1477130 [Tanacetum coccineum]
MSQARGCAFEMLRRLTSTPPSAVPLVQRTVAVGSLPGRATRFAGGTAWLGISSCRSLHLIGTGGLGSAHIALRRTSNFALRFLVLPLRDTARLDPAEFTVSTYSPLLCSAWVPSCRFEDRELDSYLPVWRSCGHGFRDGGLLTSLMSVPCNFLHFHRCLSGTKYSAFFDSSYADSCCPSTRQHMLVRWRVDVSSNCVLFPAFKDLLYLSCAADLDLSFAARSIMPDAMTV